MHNLRHYGTGTRTVSAAENYVTAQWIEGRDPFDQNFRKFRSKTQWIGSVQPKKFRKNGSTFWGGPLFPVRPVGILVEWIAPEVIGELALISSINDNNTFTSGSRKPRHVLCFYCIKNTMNVRMRFLRTFLAHDLILWDFSEFYYRDKAKRPWRHRRQYIPPHDNKIQPQERGLKHHYHLTDEKILFHYPRL